MMPRPVTIAEIDDMLDKCADIYDLDGGEAIMPIFLRLEAERERLDAESRIRSRRRAPARMEARSS